MVTTPPLVSEESSIINANIQSQRDRASNILILKMDIADYQECKEWIFNAG